MTKIIDPLMDNDNQEITDYDIKHDNDLGEQISQQDSPKGITPRENESKELSDRKTKNFSTRTAQVRDFNYPDKKVGYLTQVQTDFQFIGPDREPVELNSIDTLLNTANISELQVSQITNVQEHLSNLVYR